MWRDGSIEHGFGHPALVRQTLLAEPIDQLQTLARKGETCLHATKRLTHHPWGCTGPHFQTGGRTLGHFNAVAATVFVGRSLLHQGRAQLQAGLAIHIGVVKANQYRETVGRHTFNVIHALDDVDLPGCALHIDTAGHGAGGEDAQLAPVARLRQAYMADVIFQIEIFILQPIGIIQLERRMLETATEIGRRVQPVRNVLQNFLVADNSVRRSALITEPEAANHHRLIGSFEIEEMGIHGCKLLHCSGPRAPRWV